MNYEVVIGLEVHVELATESKLFCSCSAKFGAAANENVCPACMGMPGSPPVTNRRAIELGVMAGLLTNCEISKYVTFDKKNYFYPDLPTGYQITQYFNPICRNGFVDVLYAGFEKRIRIKQVHIEEDAGKLVHDNFSGTSLLDCNRSGVPLIEIVSMPDFNSAEEVVAYLEKLKSLLSFAGVSDCKMQEGSMRADINISAREKGKSALGTRTEMKNMNSLKAIKRAIEYESGRHVDALETGCEELVQETRRWDDSKNQSFSMRGKEDATDYRYFPNSELMPIFLSEEWVSEIKEKLPEPASSKYERYISDYGLPEQAASILTSSKSLADAFDGTMMFSNQPKEAANWILVELVNLAREGGKSIEDASVDGKKLAKLINMVDDKTINRRAAKEIFAEIYKSHVDPAEYAEKYQLGMVKDKDLMFAAAKQAISENPKPAEEVRAGNKKAIGFYIGQVMKKMGGKADPEELNAILNKLIEEG